MNESIQNINKNYNLSILLVSDFFYPKVGGVEVHIYQLAVSLVRLGCKVTVLTHHRKDRQGIKIMGNGIKVYFNPIITLYDDTAMFSMGAFKIFREIIYSEKIDIIHFHQSTSVTSLECIIYSKILGIHTVLTDHSLFGFGRADEVSINKIMRTFFINIDETISVSNIAREDLILRSLFNPKNTNIIPNGIDNTKFRPPSKEEKEKIEEEKYKKYGVEKTLTIVSVSRQAYRKGTDLLIEVIPEICKLYPNVNFIIGGDGPKKILLDDMVNASGLKDRVILTGALPHNKVRDIMIQGDIYLNTSLTESFCIAIVEAASTGLYTIATDVGGVGEVLPDYMVKLVNPDKESIINGVKETIRDYDKLKEKMKDNYKTLNKAYNWDKVASKTILVYKKALAKKDISYITRIKKITSVGHVSGFMFLCAFLVKNFINLILTIFEPLTIIKKRKKKEFKYSNYIKYLNKIKQKMNEK